LLAGEHPDPPAMSSHRGFLPRSGIVLPMFSFCVNESDACA
jgi:hypothetical protein